MSEESQAHKMLVSYAIIGTLFRRGLENPGADYIDIPEGKETPDQIRAAARKNFKRTMSQLKKNK